MGLLVNMRPYRKLASEVQGLDSSRAIVGEGVKAQQRLREVADAELGLVVVKIGGAAKQAVVVELFDGLFHGITA